MYGTRKDFLDTRHSLFFQLFFLFLLPNHFLCIVKNMCVCVCVCIAVHIPECVEIVYELTLLPNNNANETLLQKSVALRSVDWIFIIGVPAWR